MYAVSTFLVKYEHTHVDCQTVLHEVLKKKLATFLNMFQHPYKECWTCSK